MSEDFNQSQLPFMMNGDEYYKFRLYEHLLQDSSAQVLVERDGRQVEVMLRSVSPFDFESFAEYERTLVTYATQVLHEEASTENVDTGRIYQNISAASILEISGPKNPFINYYDDIQQGNLVRLAALTLEQRNGFIPLNDRGYNFLPSPNVAVGLQDFLNNEGFITVNIPGGPDYIGLYNDFQNDPSYENAKAYSEAFIEYMSYTGYLDNEYFKSSLKEDNTVHQLALAFVLREHSIGIRDEVNAVIPEDIFHEMGAGSQLIARLNQAAYQEYLDSRRGIEVESEITLPQPAVAVPGLEEVGADFQIPDNSPDGQGFRRNAEITFR